MNRGRNMNRGMGVTFDAMLVTPAVAARMLERTPYERPINAGRVRRYADDLIAGRWLETGETIKLTSDGTLLNGHHRMRAIVLSGVTTWLYVAKGVSPSALTAMDSGMNVRSSDWSGRQNANRGFAMLNSILRGFGINYPQPSRGCLQQMWDTVGDEHIQFGAGARTRLVCASASMAIAVVHRLDRARAEVMRGRLLQSLVVPLNSPEQAWLRSRDRNTYSTMETSIMAVRMAVAAVCGEEIRLLRPQVNAKEAERVLMLTSVLDVKRGGQQ